MITSRERLLRCISHEPIDRVPISTYELVGWNDNAWENNEESYKRLMDTIRDYTDCIYMLNPGEREIPNSVSEIEDWDQGISHFTKKIFHTRKGDLQAQYREDKGVHTVWTTEHLLKDIEDIDTYLEIPYKAPELDMSAFYKEQEKLGDKGLMMISIDDPICLAAELFDMSTFLVYARTETDKIKYFLDAIHERQMFELKNLLKNNVKDIIFRICGPEYATPPYLPPKYFYDFVTCYLIDICKAIKDAGGIPRIHSHGKIGKVIEQFALTEAECLDPIEPKPDGDMELSDVKRLYGDKFCLFGNIELKELETSGRERIDDLVKQAMGAAKDGSGFVLMPTAAPINVPLSKRAEENYLQMIESALRYGKY
jgi:uroporphyrinogen-III decarboxylase